MIGWCPEHSNEIYPIGVVPGTHRGGQGQMRKFRFDA